MRSAVDPIRWSLTALVLLAASSAPAAGDFLEASVRHLRQAVVPQRDGTHLPRLLALRQLRDRSLEPLLIRLAQRHEEWQVQVHAVLGLAEISPSGRLDPLLVRNLDAQAQEALIANAVDMDLIGPEEIDELLTWDHLPPVPRLLLLAELMAAGRSVDPGPLAALAESGDDTVAAFASLLLLQLGETAAFDRYRQRLNDMNRRERTRRLLWAFEAVRQYELTAALPWITRVLSKPDQDEDVIYWGVFSVLSLDTSAGLKIWRQHLGPDPSIRDCVRFCMLLLATERDIPASAYSALNSDSELVRCMVDVGLAKAAGRDPSAQLIALIDLGHPKTAQWAMSTLPDLPPEQAEKVYLHLIEDVHRDGPDRTDRTARAIEAAAGLFKIRPDLVTRRLLEVEDDSLDQEVLLLSLFETTSDEAGRAARGIRRIGAGRADSLALLLIARHAATLEKDDLQQLGMIAAGGGRVSEGLQVQAAWLYLEHSGSIDQALASVFDEDP